MKILLIGFILGFGFSRALSAVATADIDPQDTANANTKETADPEAPILKFKVSEEHENITCLLAEFSGKIAGQLTENVTSTLIINGTLGESSHCGKVEERLVIEGFDGSILDFTFGRSESSIELKKIQYIFNKVTYDSNSSKPAYTVTEGNSFKCDSGLSVDLSDGQNRSISLSLKSMRLDAFRNSSTDEYETDSICSADAKSNKTVPIIIAFVLGGMVVILLVGYILLRRTENKSVYQSV